jgi:hypothetical protein
MIRKIRRIIGAKLLGIAFKVYPWNSKKRLFVVGKIKKGDTVTYTREEIVLLAATVFEVCERYYFHPVLTKERALEIAKRCQVIIL